jgi:hypothetical protein
MRLPQMQQVFEELRDRYGPRHLETLTTEINLGLVLWDLARLDEAAAHLESLLPAIVEIRGEQHPRSLDAMNNLGLIYQGLGRHAEALELLSARTGWVSRAWAPTIATRCRRSPTSPWAMRRSNAWRTPSRSTGPRTPGCAGRPARTTRGR